MQDLREICIFHTKEESVQAVYLKGFIKWVGFFYYAHKSNEHHEEWNQILKGENNQFDLVISIQNRDTCIKKQNENWGKINIFKNIDEIWEEKSKLHLREDILESIWNEVFAKINSGEYKTIFQKLIHIYCKNNLMRLVFNNNYVLFWRKAEEPQEIFEQYKEQYDCWEKAVVEIAELREVFCKKENEYKGQEYIEYAYVYCKRKMNELCNRMQVRAAFDTRQLLEEAEAIYQWDQGFFMVESLKSKIADADSMYKMSAIFCMKDCVSTCRTTIGKSYLRYKLGKQYEEMGRRDQAMVEYRRAFEENPLHFRALFKLMIERLWREDYEGVYLYLNRILEMLELNGEGKADDQTILRLLPLELEYACKCYIIMGNVESNSFENPVNAAAYYQKAMKICESIERNKLIPKLFPEPKERENIFECLKKLLSKSYIDKKLQESKGMKMYKEWSNIYGGKQ